MFYQIIMKECVKLRYHIHEKTEDITMIIHLIRKYLRLVDSGKHTHIEQHDHTGGQFPAIILVSNTGEHSLCD